MSELSRREFAEALALAAMAPMLAGTPLALDRLGVAAALPAPDPSALAKALAGVVKAQYGARLSEADLAAITGQIETSLERAAKVRQAPLGNGDEPDFVFSALRGEPIG